MTAATYARVHVKSSTIDYEAFYGASSPAQVALTAAAWTTITESAAPGDPLTIEATKLSASGVAGPINETWTIAQGTLKGTVYYNTYDSPLNDGEGAVMRIKPGQDAEILLGGCHVCHAVSANGSTLVAMGADRDPAPDAGYPGNDPYFYKVGASFDLTAGRGRAPQRGRPRVRLRRPLARRHAPPLVRHALPGTSAEHPRPRRASASADGGPGDRPSQLYDPRDGGVLAAPRVRRRGQARAHARVLAGRDARRLQSLRRGAGAVARRHELRGARRTRSRTMVDVVAPDAGRA